MELGSQDDVGAPGPGRCEEMPQLACGDVTVTVDEAEVAAPTLGQSDPQGRSLPAVPVELHNPDLGDTIDLIEVIVRQEAPELQALGKKLQRVMDLFSKTGQDKEPPAPELTVEELNSSPAPSPQLSTSSATSTGGPTTTSSSSPSAG